MWGHFNLSPPPPPPTYAKRRECMHRAKSLLLFDFTMFDQKDFCLCSLIYEPLDSSSDLARVEFRPPPARSKSEINHFCLFLDCGYKKPTHLAWHVGVVVDDDDDESTKAKISPSTRM
jgi:hypothetical protein